MFNTDSGIRRGVLFRSSLVVQGKSRMQSGSLRWRLSGFLEDDFHAELDLA